MRLLLLALLVTACSETKTPPAKPAPVVAAPTPAPNIVCQRVKVVNPEAKCHPEYTNVGESHTYSATIEIGKNQFSCTINELSVSLVCGSPVVMVQPPVEPKKDAPKAQPKSKK